jgi:hypothetical protein
MLGPIFKGITVAASPKGRRAIGVAMAFATSEEGRRMIAQARKVATGPEARKLAEQAGRVAKHASDAARAPENQERLKSAARYVRRRGPG